ncbi:MAG: porin [bacterium]
MKNLFIRLLGAGLILFLTMVSSPAQEVKTKNAKSWELTGRAQLQYFYNSDIDGDASRTNNGFRIRRGRLQAKCKLTDWVETKFQIEVRDNSPRLKDAEGKIKLGKNMFVRLGQFKVPVWREELRSSSKLLLVERSEVAEMLADINLSARQVGLEVGGKMASGLSWAVNVSNGAGEGGREDAGRSKSGFVNNGKLFAGRVNVPVGDKLQIGVAGAANRAGSDTGVADNSGTIWTIAPDFGYYTSAGTNGQLDLEGGIAIGSVDKDFLSTAEDQKFRLFDVTARWHKKLSSVRENLGGVDAVELAAGISIIEPNSNVDDDESLFVRFGPAVYFGKTTRLQVNGEIEKPLVSGGVTIFKFRVQSTFNF